MQITDKWLPVDYDGFIKIIEMLIDKKIKEFGLTTYKSAIVDKVNENDTYNLKVVGTDEILYERKSNVGTLSPNDIVELVCKGGNLSNSWIDVKR